MKAFHLLIPIFFGMFFPKIFAQNCTGNLLQNPGFENNLTNWEGTGGELATTGAKSGTKALKLCQPGSSMRQTLPAVAGKTYTLDGFLKRDGSAQPFLFIKFLNSSWTPLQNPYANWPPTTGWTTFDPFSKVAPAGTAWIEISFLHNSGTGCVFADDLCLTESGGPNAKPDLELSIKNVLTYLISGNQFDAHLTVKNKGNAPATGVKVKMVPPIGCQFPTVFLNQNSELDFGTIAAGDSATLQINSILIIAPTATSKEFYLFGQVSAQNEPDLDSQPNSQNCATGICTPAQDDEARIYAPANDPCDLAVTQNNVVCDLGDPATNSDDHYFFTMNATGGTPGIGFGWFRSVYGGGSQLQNGNFQIQLTTIDLVSASGVNFFDLNNPRCPTGNQLVLNTTNCTPSTGCPGNLLQNAGFENALTNWGITQGTPVANNFTAASGTKSLRLDFVAAVSQKVAAVAGSIFSLTAKLKSGGASSGMSIGLRFLDANNQPLDSPVQTFLTQPPGLWTDISTVAATAPAGTNWVEVLLTANATSTSVLFVDAVCLTKSGGVLPNFIIQGGAQNMATAGTTLNDVTIILSTPASPAFTSPINGHFYLSTDQVFSANDVFLKNLDWSSVQPVLQGGTLINTGLPIPAAAAAGSYFFIFVLDPANLVAESNETDNTMTFPVAISAAGNSPDILLGAYITPPSNVVGMPATAQIFYQNAGNVAAGQHNYTLVLSTDNVLSANDLPLGGFNVASLAVGASGSNSITFTLAATQAAGIYYLIAKGDGSDALAEPNETNNIKSAVLEVTNGAPTGGCTTNLLQNAGFENNLTNWEGMGGTISTTASAGSKSLKLCQNGTIQQTIPTSAGKNLTLLFKARSEAGSGKILSYIKYLSATWQPLVTEFFDFSTNTTFAQGTVSKIAPANTAWVEIGFLKQTTGCVLLDEVCLSENITSPGITINCPADMNFTECPIVTSGPSCGNCHAITPPTATTTCAQGGLTFTFMGGTILSGNMTINDPNGPPPNNFSAFGLVTRGFGKALIQFKATDACGNTKTCSYNITVNETSPHAFYTNCPANIMVTAATGATSAIVNYTPPVLVKNCPAIVGNSNLVQGLASGAAFPIGTTTIRYNTGGATINLNCEFTVTVISGQPSGCAGNMLANGDFAQGATGWTGGFTLGGTSPAHFATVSNNNKAVIQTVPVTAGKSYFLRVKCEKNANAGSMSGWVGMLFKNGPTVLGAIYAVDNGNLPVGVAWNQFPLVSAGSTARDVKISMIAPSGATSVEVIGQFASQFQASIFNQYHFDDFCLTEGSSTLSVNCPSDITVNSTSTGGVCGNISLLTPPTATTTCPQGGLAVKYLFFETIATSANPPNVVDNTGGAQCAGIQMTGEGTVRVTFEIKDNCGNVTNCSYQVERKVCVNDISLTNCPANITLTAPAGATGVVHNYTYPTVFQTVGCQTTTYQTNANFVLGGLPSGATFPLGSTTVAITATLGGLQAVCTFNVTVNDGIVVPPSPCDKIYSNLVLNSNETCGEKTASGYQITSLSTTQKVVSTFDVARNFVASTTSPRADEVVYFLSTNGINKYVNGTPTPATALPAAITNIYETTTGGAFPIAAGGWWLFAMRKDGTSAALLKTNAALAVTQTFTVPGLTAATNILPHFVNLLSDGSVLLSTRSANQSLDGKILKLNAAGNAIQYELPISGRVSAWKPSLCGQTDRLLVQTNVETSASGNGVIEHAIEVQFGATAFTRISDNEIYIVSSPGTASAGTTSTAFLTNGDQLIVSWNQISTPPAAPVVTVKVERKNSAGSVLWSKPLPSNAPLYGKFSVFEDGATAQSATVFGVKNGGLQLFSTVLPCATLPCTLTATATNIACDNVGTATSTDDVFFYTLLVQGNGQCGATWQAGLLQGTVGVPKTIGPRAISNFSSTGFDTYTIFSNAASTTISVPVPATCSGPTGGADLKLTIAADKTTVPQWGNVTFTVTAKNEGTAPISNAVIKIGGCAAGVFSNFDQNFKLVYAGTPGAPTAGSYNFVAQEWTIPNLAAGAQGVLTLPLFTTGTAEKKVAAFAKTQSPTDPDSQPSASIFANCTPVQDDEAIFTINLGQSGQAVSPLSNGQSVADLEDFTIFPNPTDARATLNLGQFLGKNLTVSATDAFGKLVFSEKIKELGEPYFDLDFSERSNGVYFIKIETDGWRPIIKRLIINKL